MIGVYFDEDEMQKWFLKNLPIARKRLENFESLNKLFVGFKHYETKRFRDTRNLVLSLCLLRRRARIPLKSYDLAKLERAIESFDVFNWGTAKFNQLKSRITNDDYNKSLSICTELLLAKRLMDKLGNNKVFLYPKIENGESDILVELDGKVVYLEVGNLSESKPEKKIQRILNETARHLGNKLRGQCYFSVSIDTAELVFDQERHIDEKASIEKTISEIDRLCFDKLEGFKGFIFLERIAYVVRYKEILENIHSPLPDTIREDLELVKKPTVKDWIVSCKAQILQGSKLFKGGIICEPEYPRVEIRTLGMFPSKSATLELKSFLRHFITHIEGQLHQLQPKNPNIIIIQGYNWMLFAGFEPLYTRIQQFFKNRKEKYLSGVLVSEREIEKLVYVSNVYATESSRLSREDIDKLGFRWFQ